MTTTTALGTGEHPHIDLLDPASFAAGHPFEQYRWLRTHDPVHRHAEPGGAGFWAVTRYDDVRAIGRDHQRFSSEPTIMITDPGPGQALDLGDHKMMLMADPPLHTAIRRVVSTRFTPKASAAWRDRAAVLAASIVDAVAEQGACDLVTDIAGEMPSFVVAELLDLPHELGRHLYGLTETIHADPSSVAPGAQGAALAEMFGHAADLWQRKAADPGDDLASAFMAGTIGDRPVDQVDFGLFFLLLVDAGGDTTRNLVAGGMDALFAHPDQLDRLRADPDGTLPTAIEELLRWVSPVAYMRRTATVDVELHGRSIRAGDKVVMYYAAANRDERAFPDPDRLDLGRTPNHHIAFGGGGPHHCLGAHLARIEIHALLRELLVRLPDLEPAGPTEWLPSVFISGPKHLPVRFSPSPSAPR